MDKLKIDEEKKEEELKEKAATTKKPRFVAYSAKPKKVGIAYDNYMILH